MDVFSALGSGLVAGIALVVPLGAIGVLLIREGVVRGWRDGAPAAAAVASVDMLYCATAILAGALATPVIAGFGQWPAVVGGTALLVLAGVGMYRTFTRPAADPGAQALSSGDSGWRRYALFFGLTVINPATLVYFAAIAVGLAGLLRSTTAAVAFVLAVGIASFSWQLLLVAGGAVLRARAAPRAHRVTAVVGSIIVAALGGAMLVAALR
jgi:arginine exporter protein ArgO